MQKAICSLASFFSLVIGERVSNRQTLGVVAICVGVSCLAITNPISITLAIIIIGMGIHYVKH